MDTPDPAFEIAMRENWAPISRLAQRILDDREEAEEATQQTFFQAYLHWDRFEGRSEARTWIYRIAVNVCRKMCLDRRKRSAIELDESRHLAPEPGPSRHQEMTSVMALALRTIKPAHRAVLTLFYLENLDYREVATILDCPEGTLWSRLYYARKALEEKMKALAQEENR